MTTMKEINYSTYGRCVEISNGSVELYVTVDIGPRIIRYGFVGGANMMFEDAQRTICENGEPFDNMFGKGKAWYMYGGHRLWTSPEALPRTYYPDNDPVAYEIIENGARFTPKAQTETGVQMMMEITLCPDSSVVNVYHNIKNISAWESEFALWALSVMSPGGKEVVPMPDADTGLLANRNIGIWSYTKMDDPRIQWGDKFITLCQDENASIPFKFGINNDDGYAMYFNHGNMFVKKFEPIIGAYYPDNGMSYETYTNNKFIELETLSPLQLLAPGEYIEHAESWALFGDVAVPSNDETEIRAIVEKYV